MTRNADELSRLSTDELIGILQRQSATTQAPPAPQPSGTRLPIWRYLPWVVLAAVTLAGEVSLLVFNVPAYILPRPSAVLVTLVTKLPYLAPHFLVTLIEILVGFIAGSAIGILLAAFLARKPQLQDVISPYVLFLLTMPMVSLVPLLSLRFGYGPQTKMIVVALATFPVVMINTGAGLMRVAGLRLDLMRVLRASDLDVFLYVRLPGALPNIFTGLTLGVVFAVVTAVGAEFVGGSSGVGNRLAFHSGLLQTDIVFAMILLLAVFSFSFYKAVQKIGERLVNWQE